FIESPYRRVRDGKVTDEVVYLTAMEEGKYTIAQANAEVDPKGKIVGELVSCRRNGDFVMVRPEGIDFMDVSPKQLVSVAAALIPCRAGDDAVGGRVGAERRRQAVPRIRAEAPRVGAGMGGVVARDAGATIVATRSGIVDQIDGTRIVVRATDETDMSIS